MLLKEWKMLEGMLIDYNIYSDSSIIAGKEYGKMGLSLHYK